MRAVGVDLGAKAHRVALCDSGGTVASPFEVVTRTGDRQRDHRRLADLVAEAEAEVVVVGVPYSLDGSIGPAAKRALAEVEVLRRALGVPVETYDERLSTVTAHRSLREMNVDAATRRRVVDKVAAAVILQAWLDHRAAAAPDRPGADAPPAPHGTTHEDEHT